MFTTIKRLSFVILVPAVVGAGHGRNGRRSRPTLQWSKHPMPTCRQPTSREQSYANAPAAKIKPAPVQGAAEQTGKSNTESADATPSAPAPKVKRLPFVIERRSEDRLPAPAQAAAEAVRESADARPSPPVPQVEPISAAERPPGEKVARGTSEAEAAEQRPRKESDRSAREQRRTGDVRQARNEANTRNTKVARREQADRSPPRRLGQEDIDLRGVRAAITELRKSRSVEDLVARLDALGRGAR